MDGRCRYGAGGSFCVWAAYPRHLPALVGRVDPSGITHLVALNHERQREKQAGTVRYLRPAYQALGQQQATLALPTTGPAAPAATEATGPQPWPTELAEQMQAVRAVVQQAPPPHRRPGSRPFPPHPR